MFIGKQTTTILFCLTVGLSELYAVNLTQSVLTVANTTAVLPAWESEPW